MAPCLPGENLHKRILLFFGGLVVEIQCGLPLTATMVPGEYTASATFNPSSFVLSKFPLSICHPTSTVHSPSVGGLRKTHGQAVLQLHASKYEPDRLHFVDMLEFPFRGNFHQHTNNAVPLKRDRCPYLSRSNWQLFVSCQTKFACENNCFSPAFDLQFLVNVRYIIADRFFTQDQLLGNLQIIVPLR